MSVNISAVSEKVFNVLKGLGLKVDSFDVGGKQVIDPADATRFVVGDPNILVRLDKSTETIILNTSEDLADHKVRKMLKNISSDYLMNFDYKIFDKKLKPKGESQDIARQAEKDMAEVMEGFGSMEGSSKTSYQSLDNVKIVVKHKASVNEESRGSRSRNIHSVFIQRGDERFKLPENNLAMARAMARHVQKGGEVHDQSGVAIIEMAQDAKKLREFVRYVKSAKLVNETNEEYVTLAQKEIENIRETFKKLSGAKTYESSIGSIGQDTGVEILEDDLDLESQFTVKHFDNKVSSVLGQLKSLSYKKTTFESYINNAIKKETFANLKALLSENDLIDFASPEARLGHQVNQLSVAATDTRLQDYLQSVGKKIISGGQMNQFEYGTIKSCLLGASSDIPLAPTVESHEADYEAFLESYDIL